MKKKFIGALLLSLVLLGGTQEVFALSANGTGSSSSGSSQSASSSGGSAVPSSSSSFGGDKGTSGTVDKGEDTGGGCSCTVIINCKCNPLDQYNVYTPKITCIHNLNALFASVKSDNQVPPDVYYVPRLDELPFDLKSFVTGLGEEDKNGFRKSRFALVYDGFFDSEAQPYLYELPTGRREQSAGTKGRAYTSKSVAAQFNDRALETIGYDIMLKKETITADGTGGDWKFTYDAKPAGTDVLTAQVAAMDLYKAMGVFEYDVTYAFGEDADFEADTSPILQSVGFLTDKNNGEKGFNVSEGKTYIGVTRTIPRLYWERYIDDGINLGLTSLDSDDLSTIYHVAAPIQRSTKINMLQFCNMAVAIMNLYGESSISPEEELQFKQTCSKYLLDVPEATDVELDSLRYLIIKGIIKPQDLKDVDWFGGCHLYSADRQDIPTNYVLGMLGRIADKDSRYKMPEPDSESQELLDAGYMETNVTVSGALDVTQANTNSRLAYDYLIEVTDDTACYLSPRNAQEGQGETTGNEDDKESSLDITYEENGGSLHGTNIAHVADVMQRGVNVLYDMDGKPYFLDTGSVTPSLSSKIVPAMSPSQLDTYDVSSGSSQGNKPRYYYYGIVEYNGRYFYHFKFNKKAIEKLNGTEFTFSYYDKKFKPVKLEHQKAQDNLSDVKIVDKDDEPSFTVDCAGIENGGLFTRQNGAWRRFDFNDVNFSEEFIDSTRYVAIPTAAENYETLIFYVSNRTYEKKLKKVKTVDDTSWASYLAWVDSGTIEWDDLVKSKTGDTLSLKAEEIDNNFGDGTKIFAYALRPANTNNTSQYFEEYTRFEVITNNMDHIKESRLFKQSLTAAEQQDEVLKGYYRENSEDGSRTSLLVSVDYLKSQDIITDFEKISKDVYCITSSDYDNNIIINTKLNLIIVGNTVFSVNRVEDSANRHKVLEGEEYINDNDVLYKKINGVEYVNYRACFGWSGDFAIIADSAEDAVMATSPKSYGIAQKFGSGQKLEYGVEDVMTYMPSATTKTMTVDLVAAKSGLNAQKIKANGILMTGTYSLAPYIIVHTESNLANDYLFVWHFNDVMDSAGDEYKIKQKRSKKSIELLKNLLGIEIKPQKGYRLVYYVLDKKATTEKEAEENGGFQYVELESQSVAKLGASETATIGWVYHAPKLKPTKAIDIYAKTGAKKGTKLEKGDLAIPIFEIDKLLSSTKYGDANVNTCSEDENSDKCPLGTMPCTFSNNVKSGLITIKTDGTIKQAGKGISGDAYGKDTSSYHIWTAPVSLFNQIKGLGFNDVESLDNVSVYYGTAACNCSSGKLTIKGTSTAIDTESKAIVAYRGSSQNSVYVITDGVNYIKDLLEEVETKLEFVLSESASVVDWNRYSFDRLIHNLDNWSSIAYLFILAVVPRIAEFLMLILIMLSLISNVKPWQYFCRNWFDVYDALSMGHQSVDTIDMKRTVLVSMWAMALFIMIQDGVLFNFIIWISKGIVAIYQH